MHAGIAGLIQYPIPNTTGAYPYQYHYHGTSLLRVPIAIPALPFRGPYLLSHPLCLLPPTQYPILSIVHTSDEPHQPTIQTRATERTIDQTTRERAGCGTWVRKILEPAKIWAPRQPGYNEEVGESYENAKPGAPMLVLSF